jgi:hypothetical protein
MSRAALSSAIPALVATLIVTAVLAGPVSASTSGTASTARPWTSLTSQRKMRSAGAVSPMVGAASRILFSSSERAKLRRWPGVSLRPLSRSGSVNSSSSDGGTYVAIPPTRLLDTRVTGTAIGPEGSLNVQVSGAGAIPATGVCAAVLNVTDAGSTAAGYLTVFPAGATQPLASNLNFSAAEVIANQVTVPVGTGGQVTIFNEGGTTNVVVDVDGYYTCTASSTASGLYDAISPTRVLGTLASGALDAGGTSVAVSVTGTATGVPSTASAVVVNLTVAGGTASSFLSAYPAGDPLPLASNLNFVAGQTIANRATIGIGTNGQIEIYNHSGTVQVDVDVDGYYTGTAGGAGSAFYPVTPVRLTDTRSATNGTPIAAGATETFSLANGVIPSSATAVQANLTVVAGDGPGYLAVYPSFDSTPPVASDVNWDANLVVANAIIADTAGTGTIDMYNGSTPDSTAINVVIDASGYFSPSGTTSPAPPVTTTPAPLTITTTSLPSATVGGAYSATLTASGGTVPYSWAITSGSLPTGLSLSSGGTVSGTPSAAGSSTFTVEVTDSTTPTPATATTTLSVSVTAAVSTTTVTTSPNWSGYAVGGSYTAAEGTFTVPSLYIGQSDVDMAEWVGIDGAGQNEDLIQAGIAEQPDPDNSNDFYVFPWWEILPAPSTPITTLSVAVGDQITVTIGQISGADWQITVADDTTGESFTTDQTYTGPGTSAEWIVEAPQVDGSQSTLADYTPTTFTNLEISGSETSLDEWIMFQNGVQVSTPSTLTSSGFSVAYGSTAPPAPSVRADATEAKRSWVAATRGRDSVTDRPVAAPAAEDWRRTPPRPMPVPARRSRP